MGISPRRILAVLFALGMVFTATGTLVGSVSGQEVRVLRLETDNSLARIDRNPWRCWDQQQGSGFPERLMFGLGGSMALGAVAHQAGNSTELMVAGVAIGGTLGTLLASRKFVRNDVPGALLGAAIGAIPLGVALAYEDRLDGEMMAGAFFLLGVVTVPLGAGIGSM